MISIRRHLTRRLLTVTLVLIAIGVLALYLAARFAATGQFDLTLRAKALAISTSTRATPEGIRMDFTSGFLQPFEDVDARDYFQLWDESGRTLARSESLDGDANLEFRPGNLGHPAAWDLRLPGGLSARAISFAFRPKSTGRHAHEPSPELRLTVASNREDLDETLWGTLGFAAAWGAMLIGGTLWVIPRVLSRGLAPLDALGERVVSVDAATLATRLPVNAMPIELKPVAIRLNELFGRLEQSFERERRFSADLAHELRTPLAELRTLTEAALKWPEQRDRETDRETIEIVRNMEALVTHLLALTRGEQGQLRARCEPLALAPFTRSVWQNYAERAARRKLQVAAEPAEGSVSADPALLRAILSNLFDNAVEYAPAGSTVRWKIERDPSGCRLLISNEADNLGAADLEKLFDRFWRKEAARTAGTHVGLGLPLARSFAHSMGWDLNATLDAGRLTFVLGTAVNAVATEGGDAPHPAFASPANG